MMKKRFALSLLSLLAVLVTASPSQARVTAEGEVADALIRSAIEYIAYAQAVEGDAPYVLAGTLLDAAIELDPKNPDAWSLRAELAESAGDLEAYEKALVGYLGSGVEDDRARFNLIRYRLSQNNTLDAQLIAVEKLLESDTGRALPQQLRSRVATLAASIAAELLDEKARRKWVVEAARSDPANLPAAQALLELVTRLSDDPVRQGTATVNVIRADPLSPGPRIQLASLLAEQAAFDRAAQQYRVVGTRLSREPLQLEAYINWAHSLAMTGEDETALRLIEEFEKALNQPAPGGANTAPEGEGGADSAQAKPEADPVDLPLSLAVIRLAVLGSAEDKTAAQQAFDTVKRMLEKAQADADTADNVKGDAADLAPPKASFAQQLALIAAVFGPDLEQAGQIVEANRSDDVALGWLALRQGELAQAEQLLRPLAKNKSLAACGLALAVGQDEAGKARLLQEVIQDTPSSMAALAAGRKLVAFSQPVLPTTQGKAITALMSKYPEMFWLVDLERTPWLEVRMKIDPQRIMPMEPIRAEVTVWNTTRFPLAIRDEGPIKRQAMVQMAVSSSGQTMPQSSPIVVDLGRRFTLKAGERLVLDARLDYHSFGSIRAKNPGAPFVIDARLIVNPIVMPGGTWLPSGIGGVSDVRNTLIQSKPASEKDVEQWIGEIKSDVPATRLHAAKRLAALSSESQSDLVGPALLERVRGPIEDYWNSAGDAERAWLLVNTVSLEGPETSYPRLLELATASDSKLVWLAMLATHVSEENSEVARIGIGRQDLPEVSRFAERLRRLLRDFQEVQAELEREREERDSALPGATTPGDTPVLPLDE